MNLGFENDELMILYFDSEYAYYLDKRSNTFKTINFGMNNNYRDEIQMLVDFNFSKDTYQELKEWYLYDCNLNEEDYKWAYTMLDFMTIIAENGYRYFEIVEDFLNDEEKLLLIIYDDKECENEKEHFERSLA